ncbi:hypothetical protein [Aquimarina brevivitae]|uniref:Uncharacterized protein n=1 Tax=Aquimarina brevivitae TaxID=323412 RepID=A0A4Q7P1W9_9FLAO|nr:hypothetical protein [Aquimarina brevivitae]RZS93863.1 hypothetical protein EV197_2444 [Aquimarina brevivitae]
MNLIKLDFTTTINLDEFIASWSKLYSYPLEYKYSNSIHKDEFDEDDIKSLFEWKNGMNLSTAKNDSLENKVLSKINIINDLKTQKNLDLKTFKVEFYNLSAVWKIFLLHVIKPNEYPIYDQHVHRTYLFINDLDWSNISNSSISNKNKEAFYFNEYCKFIKKSDFKDLRAMDKAFFAFGQFLKKYGDVFTTS